MLKSSFSVFLFCLLRCLDCTVSQHASEVKVQVYEGVEHVLLPCQVPAGISSDSTAVVWSRDEFTIPKVHMRQQGGDDLKDQNDHYFSRTRMRGDALQTGNLSLTLRNPTYSDSGNYTCTTRRFGEDLMEIYVQLKVSDHPPPPPVWPIFVAVLVTVVILAVLYGILMYRAYKKEKNRADCMLKPEKVTQGAKSVKLPWREEENLPAAVSVKWTRVQPTVGVICECVKDQRGQWKLQPGPGYEGRLQMDPDHLTKGHFHLTLMKPRCEDGGLYLCVVYGQDGRPPTLTIVVLWVKETWETTITGLFLCGEDTAPPADEQKWMLSAAVTEILKKSYGNENADGENASVMLENSDGKENAEETRLLNAQ